MIISDLSRSSSPTARDYHLFLILIVMAIGHGGHSVSSILAHVIQLHSFDYLLKVLFDNIQAEASTPDDGMF
jgi:ABC-type enterochelin transport system permease subunit